MNSTSVETGRKIKKTIEFTCGLCVGISIVISAYFALIYQGNLSIALKILIPLLLGGGGLGGLAYLKLRRKRANPGIDAIELKQFLQDVSVSIIDGDSGIEAIEKNLNNRSPTLKAAVTTYLKEKTGPIRTSEFRSQLERLASLQSKDSDTVISIVRTLQPQPKPLRIWLEFLIAFVFAVLILLITL